jgi:hypothetical protein
LEDGKNGVVQKEKGLRLWRDTVYDAIVYTMTTYTAATTGVQDEVASSY